jgi:hypothetical protein
MDIKCKEVRMGLVDRGVIHNTTVRFICCDTRRNRMVTNF